MLEKEEYDRLLVSQKKGKKGNFGEWFWLCAGGATFPNELF